MFFFPQQQPNDDPSSCDAPPSLSPNVTLEEPRMCSLSRQELDDHLAQSGYGANAAMFRCYFDAGVMPPRCAVCHRQVGEHQAAAAAQAVVVPEQSMMLPGAPVVEVPGLQRGDSVDTVENSSMAVMIGIAVLIVVIGIGMTVCFYVAGFFAVSMAPMVAPLFDVVVAIGILYIPTSIRVDFDKRRRTVAYSFIRTVWRCCSRHKNFRFEDVQSLQLKETSMHVNNHNVINFEMRVAGDSEPLIVHQAYGMSTISEYNAWVSFLASLQIQTGGIPVGVLAR